jgi:hypothetical protein
LIAKVVEGTKLSGNWNLVTLLMFLYFKLSFEKFVESFSNCSKIVCSKLFFQKIEKHAANPLFLHRGPPLYNHSSKEAASQIG